MTPRHRSRGSGGTARAHIQLEHVASLPVRVERGRRRWRGRWPRGTSCPIRSNWPPRRRGGRPRTGRARTTPAPWDRSRSRQQALAGRTCQGIVRLRSSIAAVFASAAVWTDTPGPLRAVKRRVIKTGHFSTIPSSSRRLPCSRAPSSACRRATLCRQRARRRARLELHVHRRSSIERPPERAAWAPRPTRSRSARASSVSTRRAPGPRPCSRKRSTGCST